MEKSLIHKELVTVTKREKFTKNDVAAIGVSRI
jgi:hypothetical protein